MRRVMQSAKRITAAELEDAGPRARRAAAAALVGLLVCWLVFSGAHLLRTRGFLDSDLWMISKDGGYAEYFEYTLLLFSAGVFAFLFIRMRETLVLIVSAVLLYLTADNALTLHEIAGAFYARIGFASPVSGISPEHAGEFLYLCVVGGALIGALLVAIRMSSGEARRVVLITTILIVCTGSFTAVLDTLGGWTRLSQLAFLEDSGEMFMIVLIATYSVLLAAKHAQRNLPDSG